MSAKHTPAPWSVCGAEGCTCKAVLYRDGVICEVRDFNDDMADASGHAPSPDEAQANKRLIAAAPELLSAIIDLADAARSACNAAQHSELVQALFDADYAIRKAEGRT